MYDEKTEAKSAMSSSLNEAMSELRTHISKCEALVEMLGDKAGQFLRPRHGDTVMNAVPEERPPVSQHVIEILQNVSNIQTIEDMLADIIDRLDV